MMRALSHSVIRGVRRGAFAAAWAALALAASAAAEPAGPSPANAQLDALYQRALTAEPADRPAADNALLAALAGHAKQGRLAAGVTLEHYAKRLATKIAITPQKPQQDHRRRLGARLRLLAAAAYFVDGGPLNFRAAAAACRQVEIDAAGRTKKILGENAQWRTLRDRARSLRVAAACLAGDAATLEKADTGEGLSPPAKTALALYRHDAVDLAGAKALIERSLKAVRASQRSADSRRTRQAEGIATGAIADYLASIKAILTDPPPAGLVAHVTRLNRHGPPPALRTHLRNRARDLQQRLAERERVVPLFTRWARTPNDPALLRQLRTALNTSKHVEADAVMLYCRSICETALIDWEHRYRRADIKRYADNLTYYREILSRHGRGRPAPVPGVAETAIIPFVTALLALQAGDATGMEQLQRAGWALDTELGRAVEYYVLSHRFAAAGDDLDRAHALQVRAAALCEATARAAVADTACLGAYQVLRDTMAGHVGGVIGRRIGRHLEAGSVSLALAVHRRWAGRADLPAETKVKLLTAAMDGGSAADPALMPLAESLPAPADRRALAGELYLRQEAAAPSPGQAEAVRAALRPTTGPAVAPDPLRRCRLIRELAVRPQLARSEGVRHLARQLWLQALLGAGLEARAFAFVRTHRLGPAPADGLAGLDPAVLARHEALAAQQLLAAIHLSISGERADSLLAARDLLADEKAWASGPAGPTLRQRCYRAVQRLRARTICEQPTRREALAAYRSKAFMATPTAWRRGGKLDAGEPDLAPWRRAYVKLLNGAATLGELVALSADPHVRPPGELFARAAMDMALTEYRRAEPDPLVTCSLLDAVDRFGPPAPATPSGPWAESYGRLAELAPSDPRRATWQRRAAGYLPDDNQIDLFRRAMLLSEADDPAGCLAAIETFGTRYRELPADLRVLGSVCLLRLRWHRGDGMAELAGAVGRWCGNDPAGYLLAGQTHLRPRTRARRDVLLAVLALGSPRPTAEALRRCRASLAEAVGDAAAGRSALRIGGAEAAIARGLRAAATVALTREPEAMGRVARQLLPAPHGTADAAFYKGQYLSLPAALRPTAAEAVYAGRCWVRTAGVYQAHLEAAAAAGAEPGTEPPEVFRRWLEAEVKRGEGADDAASRVRRVLQAVADSPHAARFVAGPSHRRLAAGRIWGGEAPPADAAEKYAQMIVKTASYKLAATTTNEFTAWRALGGATDAAPYVSLWYRVHWWPGEGRGADRAADGDAWPAPLRKWIAGTKQATSARAFGEQVAAWCRDAGPAARDRRAEAWLLHYLLAEKHDVGDLAKAVGTFAFGNPEYSLAVTLLRHRMESH